MLKHKVSVIIPTRDRAVEIKRALTSVYKQSLPPHEVIVVDDGSTNPVKEVIQSEFPSVVVLRNPESVGGAQSRNIGADFSSGDYVAFLDSDDEWLPTHLERSMDILSNSGAQGTFGIFDLVVDGASRHINFSDYKYRKGNIGNYIFSFQRFDARTSTFVFNRKAFMDVRFDDNLKKHQDWDLAIRFDQKFYFTVDSIPTVRIHVNSERDRMSHTLNHEATFYFLDKIKKYVHIDALFAFCIKQIMRCQMKSEPKTTVKRYLSFISPFLRQLSFKNKLVFLMLESQLLNLAYVYRVKKFFRL